MKKSFFEKIYFWFYGLSTVLEEKGERSSGYFAGKIRKAALSLCWGAGGRILEIGCAEGLFLFQLAKDNPQAEIWGIDIDSAELAQAEKKAKEQGITNVRLLQNDAKKLTFPEGHFDAVICINFLFVLDSIDTIKEVVMSMERVCKKSGSLIFEFRSSLNLFFVLKYRFAKYYDHSINPLVLNTYHPRVMEAIIDELGLKVIKRISIGFPVGRFAPIIILEVKRK